MRFKTRKNLVAMLLAVGVIATATGCGSTESTSTTSTTEYVTEEVVEEITVDELTTKVREAMEAAPYVVSDYTVLVNSGQNNNYDSYYNKEANTICYISEGNMPIWVDVDSATLCTINKDTNEYFSSINQDSTESAQNRTLNIDEIYRTAEADSAVYTLDNITNGIATVTINYITDGNNATAVMTINTETGLIESKHYTETNENEEVVSEVKLELSYPVEGTPERL